MKEARTLIEIRLKIHKSSNSLEYTYLDYNYACNHYVIEHLTIPQSLKKLHLMVELLKHIQEINATVLSLYN